MALTLIVAKSINDVIGANREIPWYIPADLKRFKQLTVGNAVIMGRKTFDSIFKRLGKPLPDRENIVVTRSKDYGAPDGVHVCPDVLEAVLLGMQLKDDVYVIGGEQIYRQTIEMANRLEVTEVRKHFEGDARFPEINPAVWKEVEREDHRGEIDYSFVSYVRR